MLKPAESVPADHFPRLVWDRERSPAEPEATDAALEAAISRAVLSVEQLVAMIRDSGYAADPRRVAIETGLTRIDEQMMLATRALFALPTDPRAIAPR